MFLSGPIPLWLTMVNLCLVNPPLSSLGETSYKYIGEISVSDQLDTDR